MNRHTARIRVGRGFLLPLVAALLLSTLPHAGLAGDDLYQQGRAALDRRDWEQAAELFGRAAQGGAANADAALYWQAYALGKLSRVDRALAVLDELERTHRASRWLDDARALRGELRGEAAIDENDDELKAMALAGLVQSDPERALPHLEKFLASGHSAASKEQALFLLLQTGLPRATEIVVQVAQDKTRESEVRAAAVRSLGIAGGARGREMLAEVYRSAGDDAVRRAVLEAYMIGGFEQELAAVARDEPSPELRAHAIQQLGVMGATDELDRLFARERAPELRRAVLQAYMVSGREERLLEVARTDPDAALRVEAIQLLGSMGATGELEQLFDGERSTPVRQALLQAFMIAGHRAPVVRAARDAANPELRDEAIQLLGVMGGTDELWQIYETEKSIDVRKRIVQAQAVGGGTERLLAIARSDPDPGLRAAAIEGLGIGGRIPAATLTEIYRQEKVLDVRRAALSALFVAGEARTLIEIHRAERDPQLRREALQFLAVSRSEDATAYMLELLDEDE